MMLYPVVFVMNVDLRIHCWLFLKDSRYNFFGWRIKYLKRIRAPLSCWSFESRFYISLFFLLNQSCFELNNHPKFGLNEQSLGHGPEISRGEREPKGPSLSRHEVCPSRSLRRDNFVGTSISPLCFERRMVLFKRQTIRPDIERREVCDAEAHSEWESQARAGINFLFFFVFFRNLSSTLILSEIIYHFSFVWVFIISGRREREEERTFPSDLVMSGGGLFALGKLKSSGHWSQNRKTKRKKYYQETSEKKVWGQKQRIREKFEQGSKNSCGEILERCWWGGKGGCLL